MCMHVWCQFAQQRRSAEQLHLGRVQGQSRRGCRRGSAKGGDWERGEVEAQKGRETPSHSSDHRYITSMYSYKRRVATYKPIPSPAYLDPKVFLALSMRDSWLSFLLPESMSPACWV